MTSTRQQPGARTRRTILPASSLVVPVVAGSAGLAFFAWKPGVARSMLGSPRALAFTFAVGLLVIGTGWLLPRIGRGALTTAAVQAVPVTLAFLVTVLPAFRNVEVDEVVADRERVATSSAAALRGVDHDASGDVLLLRATDGSVVVRFERLDVEPGPDYQVHLVPGADRETPAGGVHVGRLRANKGNLSYPVPAGSTTDRPVTVLVWCRAFAVPIAVATLT